MGLPSPRQGNCSSVIGLIVDEGADGLWKLITGDENQYVWTGPHYPNSSTDFDSQVGNHLSSFERHSESVAHRTRPAAAAATPAKLEPGWLSRTLLTLFYRHAAAILWVGQAPEFTKHCGAGPSGGCLFNLLGLGDAFALLATASLLCCWCGFPDWVRILLLLHCTGMVETIGVACII